MNHPTRNETKARAGRKGGHVWRSNFKLRGSATDGVRKPPVPVRAGRSDQ